MTDSTAQLKLNYAAALADWCLDNGDRYFRRGDVERALRCNHLAARALTSQNRHLSYPRIESNLHNCARLLPNQSERAPVDSGRAGRKGEWLHVLNEALPSGGHTAIAARWMNNDRSGRIHSVALLSQKLPVPEKLQEAVRGKGGQIHVADPGAGYFQRAEWLRNLAREAAACVVLHVDPDDVMAGVAFGCNGGPPVLLMNHAAHVFWVGASVADLVLNCRGSQLEVHWTRVHRGIPRCATLPIPLADPAGAAATDTAGGGTREQAKAAIGIPKDAFLILTVGSSYKYLAMGELDFIGVCEDILRRVPGAYVVAVGPQEDSRWRAARERTGSRLRAVGTQNWTQVARYHRAADLYIEGFPFGSTTALLEAGLTGLPIVLAPAQCPPPYGTDGVALDDILERPGTIEDYKARVIGFATNPAGRQSLGDQVRESVRKHHTGAGWRQYLDEVIAKLPREHSVYPETAATRIGADLQEYWTNYHGTWGTPAATSLEEFMTRAFALGLRLRLTPAMRRACREASPLRRGRTLPTPILSLVCNALLPLLSADLAANVFQRFNWRCHPDGRSMRCLRAVWPGKRW